MGGRYVITGSQIGMLQVAIEKEDMRLIDDIVREIKKNQFIALSENSLRKDMIKYESVHKMCIIDVTNIPERDPVFWHDDRNDNCEDYGDDGSVIMPGLFPRSNLPKPKVIHRIPLDNAKEDP